MTIQLKPPKRGSVLRLIFDYASKANGTKTATEIADHLICTVEYVRDVCWRHKIPLAKAPTTGTGGTKWTPERIDLLRKYWLDDGLSATECAAQFPGSGITRNGVIGKAHRMGWPRRETNPHALKGRRAGRLKARSKNQPNRPGSRRPLYAVLSIPSDPVEPVNSEYDQMRRTDSKVKVKSIKELADKDCRFPLGDPKEIGFGFCAAPRFPGSSYCVEHTRRCYTNADTSKLKKSQDNSTGLDTSRTCPDRVQDRVREGVS